MVDDAANVGGTFWFSYLFVLFYLAVAAGAVTHADLFFEKRVKLPFLNIELPLLAFFALAPYLFGGCTATLCCIWLCWRRSRSATAEFDAQIAALPAGTDGQRVSDSLRGQLPSNLFVQMLAGPPIFSKAFFGWALRGVAAYTDNRADGAFAALSSTVPALSLLAHYDGAENRAVHRLRRDHVALAEDIFVEQRRRRTDREIQLGSALAVGDRCRAAVFVWSRPTGGSLGENGLQARIAISTKASI